MYLVSSFIFYCSFSGSELLEFYYYNVIDPAIWVLVNKKEEFEVDSEFLLRNNIISPHLVEFEGKDGAIFRISHKINATERNLLRNRLIR